MMRRRIASADPDDAEAARERCLRLLATRARSQAELRQRLEARGYAETVIKSVIGDLARAGLVDDEEFARSWVSGRLSAGGSGRQKLRWELRRKGLAEELIRRHVDEAIDDGAELDSALQFARRRVRRGADAAKELARIRRLLLGRGYGFETVESVLRRLPIEEEP
jgi:regulatory protein